VFRFVAKDGHPITQGADCVRVLALAKRAGVKLSMHSLRKGFGCRYAGKVSAQILQRLMRHADIKTTMAFYANVDEAWRRPFSANVTVRVTVGGARAGGQASEGADANACGHGDNGSDVL
jgi:integrase